MTEPSPTQIVISKRKPASHSLLAIGIAVIFILLALSMRLAFYINDDFLYGEVVKGPHPIAGFISVTLLQICFFMLPISYIAIFFFIVLSVIRKQKLLNITISVLALLLVLFVAHPVFLATFEHVRSSGARWCPRNLQWLSYRLKEYITEHNDTLPYAENWSEELLGQDWRPCLTCPCDETADRMISYALNRNVAGMKQSELPKDVVILFETKAAKNPVGSEEIITANNHKGKGCVVLFADMHVEFIRAEDFNDLRWKP